MSMNQLQLLSMKKYERLFPRLFPGACRLEMLDSHDRSVWRLPAADTDDGEQPPNDGVGIAWSELAPGVERRQLPSGQLQFRTALHSREIGKIGWLLVAFDTQDSVPMSTAAEALRRAFADASAFLHEEIELQSECNQLAVELTERYEELNLVYSTKDEVDYLDEGEEALFRLVHNCVDYLDVGLAALICRDRSLILHSVKQSAKLENSDALLELIATSVYDRVEAQLTSIIINDSDDMERRRLLAGRPENLLAYPIFDDHGTAIGLVAVAARKHNHIFSNGDRNLLEVMTKKASRIIHTHHDSLTGLVNRNGFEPAMVAALAGASTKNQQHCLLHIDIDQLHVINDLMGHQEGDSLIRRISKVLRGGLRETDVVARLGGDEFAVLLSNCPVDRAHEIAEKIRVLISQLSVISADRQLDVSTCIGVASLNPDADGIISIMASAEIACKMAKEGGRDRVQIFEDDNTALVKRSKEIEWIGRVQQALRDDQFQLFCQPVMPLADLDQPPHFEVLIRLLDDDGNVLSPAMFLPAAERYQLMPQIDRWVLRNTLRSLEPLADTVALSGAVFCVNLSGQSLTNTGFLAFVTDELSRSTVSSDRICFEITETAAISNMNEAMEFMGEIRKLGCRFALDDFGAGLSSFGYLKTLPVDYLKIDGSFVREVTTDEISLSMVEAICQIARTMRLATIAEYVGDDATVEVLRGIGVDYVQGFHIGKPVPLKEITDRLQSETAAAIA